MFRYMAFIWDAHSPSQSAATRLLTRQLQDASSEWNDVCSLEPEGLRVFCTRSQMGASRFYPLGNRAGVVLGTLFTRESLTNDMPPSVLMLSEQDTARILATRGRQLITSYWGRYVAFGLDPTSNTKWVVKDPTGGLPCFATTFRGVTVFFSYMADCLQLELLSFTVNWQYVTGRVVIGPQQAEQTALNEVFEVYGGECIELGVNRLSRRFYWNPLETSGSVVLEDAVQAADAVRSTAKACTHAWASCHANILHRLSGGLDSSVVLGCLRDAPTKPSITCLTYFMPGGSSDERPWARLASTAAGCDHVEHARSAKIDFANLLHMAPSASPMPGFSYLETSAIEKQIANDRQVSAVFTGDGGDSLFGRHAKQSAAADYYRRHGLRTKFFELAADVALLMNTSIWRVIADVIRIELLRREPDEKQLIIGSHKLVSRDALNTGALKDKPLPHPWFNSASATKWSRVLHVATLTHPRWFYDPLSRGDDPHPEPISPLLSQPMVEVCLQIPIYVHVIGGLDRGLARRAFIADVPREILARQWKDRVQGFLEEIFVWNLNFAREFLLDGVLVKEKLLDRQALEQVLSGRPTKHPAYIGEIFSHLVTEAWLRAWTGNRYRAAA